LKKRLQLQPSQPRIAILKPHKEIRFFKEINELYEATNYQHRAVWDLFDIFRFEDLEGEAVKALPPYLLTHTQLDIADISHNLQFDEPTNFGKFFKKYVGLTPLQFRNRKPLKD
jgi:AraC-like DNA-binding protein